MIIQGDCLDVLKTLPARSVHTCVTSPPYFGLRKYGDSAEIGAEPTPDEYVAALVAVFREVRRVLRDDATVWLNLGDSYASNPASGGNRTARPGDKNPGDHQRTPKSEWKRPPGLKPKDLIGIPWRVAFALQADGWWLRQDLIWEKKNPMPESVRDRCTKAHEYVFLLSKGLRYYFDADAIKEPASENSGWAKQRARGENTWKYNDTDIRKSQTGQGIDSSTFGSAVPRNKRSVWSVASQPYSGAHFATFPRKLIEPCILAGTSERGCCPHCGASWVSVVDRETFNCSNAALAGTIIEGKGHPSSQVRATHDIRNGPSSRTRTVGFLPACPCQPSDPVPCAVLDPFIGAGTTALVCHDLGRECIGIELYAKNVALAEERLAAHIAKGTQAPPRQRVKSVLMADPGCNVAQLDMFG